jgi:PEP-CTERM motif
MATLGLLLLLSYQKCGLNDPTLRKMNMLKGLSLLFFLALLFLVLPGSAYPVVEVPVPEATTMLLLGSGLIGAAGFWRIFRK